MKAIKYVMIIVLGLSALISSTTFAAVRCMSVNAAGNTWFRTRPTRYKAITSARRACQNHSANPGTCVVPAVSCRGTSVSRVACVVRDRKNRRWYANDMNRPCKHALHKCRRWHRNHALSDNWKCWVI